MTYEDVLNFCEEQDVRFIRLSYFDIFYISLQFPVDNFKYSNIISCIHGKDAKENIGKT